MTLSQNLFKIYSKFLIFISHFNLFIHFIFIIPLIILTIKALYSSLKSILNLIFVTLLIAFTIHYTQL